MQAVLSAQKEFDAKKKVFAEEVASVAAKVSAEKAEVDALGKSAGTVIVPPTATATAHPPAPPPGRQVMVYQRSDPAAAQREIARLIDLRVQRDGQKALRDNIPRWEQADLMRKGDPGREVDPGAAM